MPINTSVKPLNKLDRHHRRLRAHGRLAARLWHQARRQRQDGALPQADADAAICWSFDADVRSPRLARKTPATSIPAAASSCATTRVRGSCEKVFGVVSGGRDDDCVKNDLAINVDVFQYRDWIAEAGEGRLSSAMCGSPLWEGNDHEPGRTIVHLDETTPDAKVTASKRRRAPRRCASP